MRGDSHDRARAVLHEHVVGDPDRDPLAAGRIRRVHAGEDACLDLFGRALLAPLGSCVARVRLHLLVLDPFDERVFGSEDEEGRTKDRVGARREDGHVLVELVDAEQELGTLGAADPVPLDRFRALGPVTAGG